MTQDYLRQLQSTATTDLEDMIVSLIDNLLVVDVGSIDCDFRKVHVHTDDIAENDAFSFHLLVKPYEYLSELKTCGLWPPKKVRRISLAQAIGMLEGIENRSLLRQLYHEDWHKRTVCLSCHACCLPSCQEAARAFISHVRQAAWVCLDCVPGRKGQICRLSHPKEPNAWNELLKSKECCCYDCNQSRGKGRRLV